MLELLDALRHHAEASGDRVAFSDATTRLTYGALARRVAAVAADLRALPVSPPVIGLFGGNCVDWVVGQLAGWHAGKIVVPLPPFFRVAALRQIVADAGIGHILATSDMVETAKLLGAPMTPISGRQADITLPSGSGGGQVIYTSGSTGQPKGVLLGGGQMTWSARTLAEVIGVRDDDTYLSVLPLALLLEAICAVLIPILAGASARLETRLAARFAEADGNSLAEAVALHRPSCMVLVPHLLANWIAAMDGAAEKAPDSLRFVAVGGAAVPAGLAQRGWELGIPVYEGYGLSECGSVVALNRPGERKAGTVGRALPGLDVRVEQGEIVVHGAAVMERYLHGAAPNGVWRTGDVGEIDSDGNLTVRGRRDNLIVTPIGRNISPEWIEALLVADKRIAYSVVTHVEGPHLSAVIVPTALGEDWFTRASSDEIDALVAECCREAPAYAVPRQCVVVPADELIRAGLLTGNGRIRRKAMLSACAALLANHDATPPAAAQRAFRI